MCINFENTCALNLPVFLSIVKKKKKLGFSSQFVTFMMIGHTVQTVNIFLGEINLVIH